MKDYYIQVTTLRGSAIWSSKMVIQHSFNGQESEPFFCVNSNLRNQTSHIGLDRNVEEHDRAIRRAKCTPGPPIALHLRQSRDTMIIDASTCDQSKPCYDSRDTWVRSEERAKQKAHHDDGSFRREI